MSAKTNWAINPAQSEISFKVVHLMVSNVKGVFRKYDAIIETTGNNFTSTKIVFWINPSGLETGNKKRDEHLKSAEFFDIKQHKKITFVSSGFEKSGKDDCYNLFGYLTMKGITNSIKLDVKTIGLIKDPFGNEKADFTINGKISRKDWGLNWNSAADIVGAMGSDEVIISCAIELQKSGEEELAVESILSMSNADN